MIHRRSPWSSSSLSSLLSQFSQIRRWLKCASESLCNTRESGRGTMSTFSAGVFAVFLFFFAVCCFSGGPCLLSVQVFLLVFCLFLPFVVFLGGHVYFQCRFCSCDCCLYFLLLLLMRITTFNTVFLLIFAVVDFEGVWGTHVYFQCSFLAVFLCC